MSSDTNMDNLIILFYILLATAPHFGYVAQLWDIHKSGDYKHGYSILVSLILLVSNTLRIYYYFGQEYAVALFIQSILGIATHLALVYVVLRLKDREELINSVNSLDVYPSSIGVPVSAADNNAINDIPEVRKEVNANNSNTNGAHILPPLGNPAGRHAGPMESPIKPPGMAVSVSSSGNAANYNTAYGESIIPVTNTVGGGEELAAAAPPFNPERDFRQWYFFPLRLLFRLEAFFTRTIFHFSAPQFTLHYVLYSICGFAVTLLYFFIFLSKFSPSDDDIDVPDNATKGGGKASAQVRNPFYWKNAPEVVGYTSLTIEACLVLPQIIKNIRQRSTAGISILLILTWVGGDCIKLVYYIVDNQPTPFIVGCAFQIFLDIIVVAQIVYYSRFCYYRSVRHE